MKKIKKSSKQQFFFKLIRQAIFKHEERGCAPFCLGGLKGGGSPPHRQEHFGLVRG
jgi:hypothetical protein